MALELAIRQNTTDFTKVVHPTAHANPDELQPVSFHPGVMYNAEFKNMGLNETDMPFDGRKDTTALTFLV